MLDDIYFRADAPLNTPVRYLHDGCSDGKSPCLIVTRVPNGWIYVCHRCGVKGFRGVSGMPGRAVGAFLAEALEPRARSPDRMVVELPRPLVPDFPPAAMVWLDRYGIGPPEIQRYHIAWAPGLQRVIFPVFRGRRVVYWIGRRFGEGPKWLSQKAVGRADIYFAPFTRAEHTTGVVLVEDILSALVVNRVINCIALLGSYIPDELVSRLSHTYQRILLWLDADKAEYALRRTQRYRSFGLPVERVYSPRDPKEYSVLDIQTFIKGDKSDG